MRERKNAVRRFYTTLSLFKVKNYMFLKPYFSRKITCCVGVWASYDPSLGLVLLDTEGMLGLALNENIRTRLLLKVSSIQVTVPQVYNWIKVVSLDRP
jgi:hypothetical protein